MDGTECIIGVFSRGFSVHRQLLGNGHSQMPSCKTARRQQGPDSPRRPTPSGFLKVILLLVPPFLFCSTGLFAWGGGETHAVIFFQVKRKVKTKTKSCHGHFLGRFMPRTCEKVSTYTVSFSLRCLLENIPMMLCPLDSTKPATCFVSGLLLAQRGGDGLGPHLGHWCEQVSSFVLPRFLGVWTFLSLSPWSSRCLAGPAFPGLFAGGSSTSQALTSVVPRDFRALLQAPSPSRKSPSVPCVFCGP